MMDILNYRMNYKDNKSFKLFKNICETYGDVVVENDYLTVTFKDGSEAKFGLKTKDIILKNFLISGQNAAIIIINTYIEVILRMIADNQSIKDMTLVKTDEDTKELFINIFNGKVVNDDVFLSKETSYSYNLINAYYYQPESGGVRYSYNFVNIPEFNTNKEHVIEMPPTYISYISYETEYPNIKVSPKGDDIDHSKVAARSTNDYYEVSINISYACSYYQDNVILTGSTYNKIAHQNIIDVYLDGHRHIVYPVLTRLDHSEDIRSVIIYDADNLENASYLSYDTHDNFTYLNAYELTYYSYNMRYPVLEYFVE